MDTICLYTYHWGHTTVDIITMSDSDTVIPMKTVYGRVVPGLTRNAVSNRVPKIGAKTVALSEAHIAVLKKLQLPITARSHYLTVTDFIKVCQYYGRTPPRNMANFACISSRHNPAEVLKSFNTQHPVFPTPSMGVPPGGGGGGGGGDLGMFSHSGSVQTGQAANYSSYGTPHPGWRQSMSDDSISDTMSLRLSPVSEGNTLVHSSTLLYTCIRTCTCSVVFTLL